MKKILFSIFILIITLNFTVFAKEVEYEYIGITNNQKRIQLVGTMVPDKDIKMIEYNHEVSFPINKKNRYQIPKYTYIEKYLLDKYGYKTINNFLSKDFINIEGSKNRFLDNNNLRQEYSDIELEKKEVLYTNMNHNRTVLIDSKINQEVIFELYPVPSEYSSLKYSRESLSYPHYSMPDKKILFTLYDTTSEYYNLNGFINNKPLTLSESYDKVNNGLDFSELNPIKIDIEKKYELFLFKREFPVGLEWKSRVVIPYYEFKVNLSKGKNILNLNYST